MLQHENVASKYDLVLKGHTAVVEHRSRNPIQVWKHYISKKHMKEAHTRLMEWYNRDDITSMINELRRSTDNAHRNFLVSSQCFISSYYTLRSDLSQIAMTVTLAAQNKDMSTEIRLGNQFSCYSARQTPEAQQALLRRLAVLQIQDSEAIPIMFYLIHELEGRENYLIHERLFDRESKLLIQRSPESIPHDSIIYPTNDILINLFTYQLFEICYQPTGGCLKEEELYFRSVIRMRYHPIEEELDPRTAQPSFVYLEKVNKAYIQPLWGLLVSSRADPSKSLQDQASALANAITVAMRGPKSSGSGSFVELTSLRPVRQLLKNRVRDQRSVTKRAVNARHVSQLGDTVGMNDVMATLLNVWPVAGWNPVRIAERTWQAWDARQLRYFLRCVGQYRDLERAFEKYRFVGSVSSQSKRPKYAYKMIGDLITVGMGSAGLMHDLTLV